jgi:rubrerythrin
MRPGLLHPRGTARISRRQRRTHRASSDEAVREPTASPGEIVVATGNAASAPAPRSPCDPAVQRVRDAGGPVDQASYVCECGYLFSAAVSTTVTCPHCGADQSW